MCICAHLCLWCNAQFKEQSTSEQSINHKIHCIRLKLLYIKRSEIPCNAHLSLYIHMKYRLTGSPKMVSGSSQHIPCVTAPPVELLISMQIANVFQTFPSFFVIFSSFFKLFSTFLVHFSTRSCSNTALNANVACVKQPITRFFACSNHATVQQLNYVYVLQVFFFFNDF